MSRNNSYLKKLEQQYNDLANKRKLKIRLDPNRFRRFWKWVWYFISFPFVWLFFNIRDWRSLICVIISFLLWSSSVWAFYLAALLCGWTTDAAKWLIGIGSAVWLWWLSPMGSPFILLVTVTSIGLKSLFNIFKKRKHHKYEPADITDNPEYIPVDKEKQP